MIEAAERLSGTVEHVSFHNGETGFCVLRVRVRGRREPVTVVGSVPCVHPGEHLDCQGHWINHTRYGLQFRAEHLRTVPPATREGIEKYLASGMVRGIGPHFAKKLVQAFGDRVFEVVEQQPQRLEELEGIGPKRRERIVAAFAEQRKVREIMVFLQSHGVGGARAVRIYKTYGDEAIARIREDPYCLARDIWGIGFKTADRIAHHLGIPRDALLRARAGLHHVLQVLAGQGHCAAPKRTLLEEAERLLEIPGAILDRALETEAGAGNLVVEAGDGEALVYLRALHRAETGCARHLLRLLAGPPPWGRPDPDRACALAERRTGLILSLSQRRALCRLLGAKVAILTGGPGVGKTTLINSLLSVLKDRSLRIALAAPTGRAAKRLSESTGLEAKTVHRLLVFDPETGRFRHGPDHPLSCDLLVVDEASMLDVVLTYRLLAAVPDSAAVLLVGDVDQLPSVGPGAVLRDLIASRRVPFVRLTEVHRQAQSSRIITNAHRINKGLLPEVTQDPASDFFLVPARDAEDLKAKLLHLVTERIPERFGIDPVQDLQVLVPMNRGGLGVRALNLELQQRLNPDGRPHITRFGTSLAPGDKVIQQVNDYDRDVFNGDIGRILAVDQEEEVVTVDFDGRAVAYDAADLDEVSLAYAISIHKSQGSEYPVVVVPLSMQHYPLLERNLLYTAVTRGRKLVVVVAEDRALRMAVYNRRSKKRVTRLAERLSPESVDNCVENPA